MSDCVGSSFSSSNCKDTAKPVPCGDGSCRSNYVACLRAISDAERRDSLRSSILWAFKRYAGREDGPPPGDVGILEASAAAQAAAAAAAGVEGQGAGGGGLEEAQPGEVMEGVEEAEAGQGEEGAAAAAAAAAAPALGPGGAAAGAADAAEWERAGDAYMRAVFGQVGKEDRAGGTRAVASGGGGGAAEAGKVGAGVLRGKGGKLAASSEVHRWSGSLEYTSEGLVGKKKRKV